MLFQLQGLPATETSPSGAWEMAATASTALKVVTCLVSTITQKIGLQR